MQLLKGKVTNPHKAIPKPACDKEGGHNTAAQRRPNKVVPLSLTFICPAGLPVGRSLSLSHSRRRDDVCAPPLQFVLGGRPPWMTSLLQRSVVPPLLSSSLPFF